jgi:hypothetical protein
MKWEPAYFYPPADAAALPGGGAVAPVGDAVEIHPSFP